LHKVKRNEHKGFDYALLTKQIQKYFNIIEVNSIPFKLLPTGLSFGIGIIAHCNQ
jgi:hypothetical protein